MSVGSCVHERRELVVSPEHSGKNRNQERAVVAAAAAADIALDNDD